MLTIRPEQMAVLSAYMWQRFEERMVRRVKDRCPKETEEMTEEKLQGFVKSAISKGLTYSIELESDLSRWILLTVRKGLDFEQAPAMLWARDILSDHALPGTAKLDLITRKLAKQEKANG